MASSGRNQCHRFETAGRLWLELSVACPFQTNLKGMDKLGLANGKLASLGRTAALSAFLAPPITRCAFNLARRGAVACGLRKLKAKSTTAPTAAGQQGRTGK
jgi:hypothetical protein